MFYKILHVLISTFAYAISQEINPITRAIPELGFSRTLLKTGNFHYYQLELTSFFGNSKIHFEYYIEANEEANWFEAQQKCRTFSAQLASFDTAEKLNSIANYLQRESLDGSQYWLSGNDLSGQYLWLSTGQKMNDFTATDNATDCNTITDLDIPELEKILCSNSNFNLQTTPETSGNSCVYLHHAANNVPKLSSDLCYRKRNYICEFRNPKTYTIVI